jgi:hypothetical protein
MTKSKQMSPVVRTLVAVATSVLTGAGAGAALARKPLGMGNDRRR